MPTIDLNADLGEGAGHDEALLDVVTSANVACGAHAGDPETMRATCAAAAARGVVIGAHPGYPDRANVGRVAVDLTDRELRATLATQFVALTAAALDVGARLAYVKAHGALYHRAAEDPATERALVGEARSMGLTPGEPHDLIVLGPPGAVSVSGATTVVEGFADRAYELLDGGRPGLVDRSSDGALLGHDAAVAQAVALATTGEARAIDGRPVAVHPRSLCVHGDTPGAVELAQAIRAALLEAGVTLAPFAR